MQPTYQGKHYFLTGPNTRYWDNDDEFGEILTHPNIKYLSIGRHTGIKTGYEHVHINLELNKVMRLRTLKGLFGNDFNIQARMGKRDQADQYLKKDGRFRIVINNGDETFQGKRTDREIFDEYVLSGKSWDELVVECPNFTAYHRKAAKDRMGDLMSKRRRIFKVGESQETKVILYLGKSGSGKSTRARTHPKFATALDGDGTYEILPTAMELSPTSGGKMWWDGIDTNTNCVFLDEFDGGWMEFSEFCAYIKNDGPKRMEVKGRFEWPSIKTWLISSIRHPCEWFGNSKNYQADPEQLWRRIDEIWWCEDRFTEPIQLNKEEFKNMSMEEWQGWMKFGRNKWLEHYN